MLIRNECIITIVIFTIRYLNRRTKDLYSISGNKKTLTVSSIEGKTYPRQKWCPAFEVPVLEI